MTYCTGAAQPGGRLELPDEVVGAEAGHRRQLLQGQAGFKVFLDVLDDDEEPNAAQEPTATASHLLRGRSG